MNLADVNWDRTKDPEHLAIAEMMKEISWDIDCTMWPANLCAKEFFKRLREKGYEVVKNDRD